jgi:hypothetical protein
MAAATTSGKAITEFDGVYKCGVIKVDGSTNTDDTVTISELATIVATKCSLAETSTADCATAQVTSISNNIMTVRVNQADGTICTQTPLDFYIFYVGTAATAAA